MHPKQSGGIPANRYINGELSTNADGSVTVRGTNGEGNGKVGAIREDGTTLEKDGSAGQTFFPEHWTADDIMDAGAKLFCSGKYKYGNTRVTHTHRGVKMQGFLEKGSDGIYRPSTFFPKGK